MCSPRLWCAPLRAKCVSSSSRVSSKLCPQEPKQGRIPALIPAQVLPPDHNMCPCFSPYLEEIAIFSLSGDTQQKLSIIRVLLGVSCLKMPTGRLANIECLMGVKHRNQTFILANYNIEQSVFKVDMSPCFSSWARLRFVAEQSVHKIVGRVCERCGRLLQLFSLNYGPILVKVTKWHRLQCQWWYISHMTT